MTGEENTTDETKDKTISTRGTSFPILSLPDAAAIIRDAGKYGKQHNADAIAQYAGHTTANSGPFKQKLAALREWGLIAKSGDKLALTETAMKIAHPPTVEAERQALLSAFHNAKLFSTLYDETAKGMPLKEAMLANSAVNTHNISVNSKAKFIQSFVDSAVEVGLAERLDDSQIRLNSSAAPKDTAVVEDEDEPSTPDSGKVDQSKGRPAQLNKVINQVWSSDGSQIVLEVYSANTLTAATFSKLGTAVTSIENLWETLNQGEATTGEGHTTE